MTTAGVSNPNMRDAYQGDHGPHLVPIVTLA